MGYQLVQNPPHPRTIITPTKRTQPPNTPIEAYISGVKQASFKLPTHEAEGFRSDVNKLLKQQQQQQCHCNNQCNLNPPQCRAPTQLKQDNPRVVLTADKGVVMVIMDQEDYTNKALTLPQDTNTYKVLKKDPTSQLKNKLSHPQGHQTHSRPQHEQIQTTISHQHSPPKFYGLPKMHKVGTSLRPIVSSRGSITYGVAKELAWIIKPLVGQSPHHLKNTQHFYNNYRAKCWNRGRSSPPLI